MDTPQQHPSPVMASTVASRIAAVGGAIIAVSLGVARTAPCQDSDGSYGLWKALLVFAALAGGAAIAVGLGGVASQRRIGQSTRAARRSITLGLAVLVATPTIGFVGGWILAINKCGLF